MKRLFPFLLLASALFAADRKAPELNFTLPGQGPRVLSHYRGQVVALEFIMTTCPHCQRAAGMMAQIQTEYASKGFQAIDVAINGLDNGATAEQADQLVGLFALSFHTNFPVGWSSRDAMQAFAGYDFATRYTVPHYVLIDRKGVIRYESPAIGDPSLTEAVLRSKIESLVAEKQ